MKNQFELDVVYGPHSVIEAARSGRKMHKIYGYSKSAAFGRVMESLPKKYSFVPVEKVGREVLDRMSDGQNNCGVAAAVSPFGFETKDFDPQKNPRVLLLDGIQDVGNLGSILRSAHCSGFGAIVLIPFGSATLTAHAIAASAGLAQHLKVRLYPRVDLALSALSKSGYTIVSTVCSGGQDIRTVDVSGPLCVVIGNEQKGISAQTKARGVQVTLPQADPKASYNASVAAAIFMFWFSYGGKKEV